jgi:hypothetical protein
MTSKRKNLLRAIFAIAIVAGMIAAPLCGPLCAAGACSPRGSSASAGCHEETALGDSDGTRAEIGAAKICSLSEAPAAKLDERAGRLEQFQQGAAPLAASQASPIALERLANTYSPQERQPRNGPPGLAIAEAPVILRI